MDPRYYDRFATIWWHGSWHWYVGESTHKAIITGLSDEIWNLIFRGTGASVIYPLLACSLSPTWTFIATGTRLIPDKSEVNLRRYWSTVPDSGGQEHCIQFATKQNHLGAGRSCRSHNSESFWQPKDPRVRKAQWWTIMYSTTTFRCDFTMCNPPFYASKEDVTRAAEDKEFDPSAVSASHAG
jgi:hypothetical protein